VDAAQPSSPQWFIAGDEVFPAMLAAIGAAVESVAFETYIYADCHLGEQFRAALIEAAQRGVRVRVLVDAFGSLELPDYFWHPLQAAGAEVRVFNPIAVGRLGIRDHRKLLACDGREAFIGGFNIAHDYEGDGVTRGWCDLGCRVTGALAAQLEASFDRLFALADFRHRPFVRLRRSGAKRTLVGAAEQLLLSGPGRGASPLYRALRKDLRRAAGVSETGILPARWRERLRTNVSEKLDASPDRRDACPTTVRIVVAYFLPPWRLRRELQRVSRRGGRVQLILAGKSDVAVSQLAGRSLYQRLLRAGVEVYEYQPQVLHAKLFIVGDAVYAGSANLDLRSLKLNYELMARFEEAAVVAQANDIFDAMLARSRRIEKRAWKKSRSFWTRWKERWANFLLARVDPYLSLRQWRAMGESGRRKAGKRKHPATNIEHPTSSDPS
jgi:cardiolipin synthase